MIRFELTRTITKTFELCIKNRGKLDSASDLFWCCVLYCGNPCLQLVLGGNSEFCVFFGGICHRRHFNNGCVRFWFATMRHPIQKVFFLFRMDRWTAYKWAHAHDSERKHRPTWDTICRPDLILSFLLFLIRYSIRESERKF